MPSMTQTATIAKTASNFRCINLPIISVSENAKTAIATAKASHAARLIDAGKTKIPRKVPAEAIKIGIHRSLMRPAADICRMIYTAATDIVMAMNPPYGPGFPKLPVIPNVECPETLCPNTCCNPITAS